jgi:hypothetical protein
MDVAVSFSSRMSTVTWARMVIGRLGSPTTLAVQPASNHAQQQQAIHVRVIGRVGVIVCSVTP